MQMRPQRSRLQRWLGSRHGEQALSVALLVLGTLLAIALVGAFLASLILWRRGFGDVRVQCDTNGSGCPPTFSPTFRTPEDALFVIFSDPDKPRLFLA